MRIPLWSGILLGVSTLAAIFYVLIVGGGWFLEWSGLGDIMFTFFAAGQLIGFVLVAAVAVIGLAIWLVDRLRP